MPGREPDFFADWRRDLAAKAKAAQGKPLQYDWEMQAGDRERLNKWKQGQDFHPPTEGFWSHQISLGKSPQEIDSLWDQTPDREKDEWFNKREFDKELQSQGASEPRPTAPYRAPMREAAEARASRGGGDAQTLLGPLVMQMKEVLKTGLYDPVGKRPSVESGTGGTIGPRPQVVTQELMQWLDSVSQGNLNP